MKPLFVIIPKLDNSGPVKGSIALCHGLLKHHPEEFQITLIVLKGISIRTDSLNPKIKLVDVSEQKSFLSKVSSIKKLLGNTQQIVISFCFSADFCSALLPKHHIKLASVRGNLSQNYKYTYGLPGVFLSWFHYRFLRRFHRVLALSQHLKSILEKEHSLRNVELIYNFLDETDLSQHRSNHTKSSNDPFHFLFVGGLTNRKRPELLLQAFLKLQDAHPNTTLTFVGDGPLRSELLDSAQKSPCTSKVRILGPKEHPYDELKTADCFVLPSESEGVPRAAMEALYFGVPCILRNIEANPELIVPNQNGFLFATDADLANCLSQGLQANIKQQQTNLLPKQFEQQTNINKIRDIIRGFY